MIDETCKWTMQLICTGCRQSCFFNTLWTLPDCHLPCLIFLASGASFGPPATPLEAVGSDQHVPGVQQRAGAARLAVVEGPLHPELDHPGELVRHGLHPTVYLHLVIGLATFTRGAL